MAIKNILCWLVVFSFFILSSCAKLKVRTDKDRTITPQTSATTDPLSGSDEDYESGEEPVVAPPPPSEIPKVAVIFGPGGAKSYSAIGFLQEMHKQRIPIHAVAGIEWGSLIAAYFSLKGSVNEVEWQMGKIKSDQPMSDVSNMKKFFNETLGKHQVAQAKLPFACTAYNMTKNQNYMMNKGPYNELVPYCLAYPPLFRAHNSNISGIREVKSLAQYLRSQGADYVVLINVLGWPSARKNMTGDANSPESLYWNEIAGFYGKPVEGVNHVVNLDTEGFTLFDFDRKRDIIQKGASSSSSWVQSFAQKYGF